MKLNSTDDEHKSQKEEFNTALTEQHCDITPWDFGIILVTL